jgi:uncharacterized protein YpuA (DUF1002 family)
VVALDRAEIQKHVNQYQTEINHYLEEREKAEIDFLQAKNKLRQIEDKLERLSKEMIKLMIERNN